MTGSKERATNKTTPSSFGDRDTVTWGGFSQYPILGILSLLSPELPDKSFLYPPIPRPTRDILADPDLPGVLPPPDHLGRTCMAWLAPYVVFTQIGSYVVFTWLGSNVLFTWLGPTVVFT